MGFWDTLGDIGRIGIGIGTAGASEAYFGGKDNANAQDVANQANIDEAKKNRDFQERMSGSAYQRAMADMALAGLNPMLAFSQGGASQPSGSQATVQSNRKGDANIALSKMAPEAANMMMDMNVKSSQAQQAQSQTKLNDASTAVQQTVIGKNIATARETAENTKLIQANRLRTERANRVQGSRQTADEYLAPVDSILDRLEQGVGIYGTAKSKFWAQPGLNKIGAPRHGSWDPKAGVDVTPPRKPLP